MSLEKPTYEELERIVKQLTGEVHKRKRTEEILREEEQRYRSLTETLPDAIMVYSEGKIALANSAAGRLCGVTNLEQLIGKSIMDFVPLDCQDGIKEQIRQTIEDGKQVPFVEQKFIQRDGTIVEVEVATVPFTYQYKPAAQVIARDITERKRAEEQLRESEERFRNLTAAAQDAIIMINSAGAVSYWNQAAEKMFGYSIEEIEGKKVHELLAPEHYREAFQKGLALFNETGDGPVIGKTLELVAVKKGGTEFPIELSVSALFFKGQWVAIGIAREITEKKQGEEKLAALQEQLLQSQKMEAIGQLAGGVAHDFNNLLTIIIIQCQLSLRALQKEDPVKEKLKDIEQAAERAARLTRQLLAFSRRQILEMKVADLNIILGNLEKMLHRVIGEDIELTTILSDELGMVKVDPVQMEQVIVNLVVNAKDAMPQGGKLFLETANLELDEEDGFFHLGMLPGAYVLLSVTDTGIGMTKEVKEQIFDPFFTTKEKGKGTGLGLSTVYGIVKQSGGDIYVYSEPNKGTTLKIYLPQVFATADELTKEKTREEISRGNETILVVEDDGMVRRSAVDILRKQGYTVLEATEGAEGLLICEQEKRPIHLILTDVIMPKMSGPQFIEQLKQVRKDCKVLYMSGYADEAIMNHGILKEGVNLINKPFTFDKLATKIREVLDKN